MCCCMKSFVRANAGHLAIYGQLGRCGSALHYLDHLKTIDIDYTATWRQKTQIWKYYYTGHDYKRSSMQDSQWHGHQNIQSRDHQWQDHDLSEDLARSCCEGPFYGPKRVPMEDRKWWLRRFFWCEDRTPRRTHIFLSLVVSGTSQSRMYAWLKFAQVTLHLWCLDWFAHCASSSLMSHPNLLGLHLESFTSFFSTPSQPSQTTCSTKPGGQSGYLADSIPLTALSDTRSVTDESTPKRTEAKKFEIEPWPQGSKFSSWKVSFRTEVTTGSVGMNWFGIYYGRIRLIRIHLRQAPIIIWNTRFKESWRNHNDFTDRIQEKN